MAKTTLFQSSIESIIARAASDIASAVRSELAQQVSKLGATQPVVTPPRRRGRPPKAAAPVAGAKPAAAKAPKAKPAKARKPKKGAKFVRRSSSEIDADNAKILAYVKANPGQRSEQIQKGVGFAKPIVAAALQALRDAKRVSMKGVKRAATYTAG